MSKKNYRITHSGAGPFVRNDVVTADQIKAAGHDLARWQKLGAVEATEDAPTVDAGGELASVFPEPKDGEPAVSDEQNKLNIERAIRDQSAARNAPLSVEEQDAIAADATAKSGQPQAGEADAGKRSAKKADAGK